MTEEKRARAIGGVFFRSKDPEATKKWYGEKLGIKVDTYGANFGWRHEDDPEKKGYTAWSPFKQDTDYFGDKDQQFMVNYRVDDLEGLVEKLKAEGVIIAGDIMREEYASSCTLLMVMAAGWNSGNPSMMNMKKSSNV